MICMFDIISKDALGAHDVLVICCFDKNCPYSIHHICDMVQIGNGAYIAYARGHRIEWV